MSTYKPKFLTDADIVRTIEPSRLIALLKPYSDYFASRKLPLPKGKQAGQLDVDLLVELLRTPDEETPQELLNAIGYIDEMATPQGMDALLRAAIKEGMPFDGDLDQTPADIAVQVWLYDPKIVEEEHAWQTWKSPRRMECFLPVTKERRSMAAITTMRIDQATNNLGAYFGESNRSKFCKLHVRELSERVEISVQRGDPFQRTQTIEEDSIRHLHFRPAGKDVVVFRKEDYILQCNSAIKRAIPIYQRTFGILLFDDPSYFCNDKLYSLAPLENLGEDALSWGDVDEIEGVVLVRHRVSYGTHNAYETFEADDVVLYWRSQKQPLQFRGKLVDATFKVKFRGVKAWRTVKIYDGNAACYTRDTFSEAAERWLSLRGFIVNHHLKIESKVNDEVLASA